MNQIDLETEPAFDDMIRPRRDGGVDIRIDHPRGDLVWQLPRERAVQFRDALDRAIGVKCHAGAGHGPPVDHGCWGWLCFECWAWVQRFLERMRRGS